MRFVFLVLLTVLTCEFASANGFVGNAGQGVKIGNKLYLRDLVSAGIHENPHVGLKDDLLFPSLQKQAQMGFTYPSELLKRKLVDVNRLAPGLGDYLNEAIKAYSWSLQDYDLVPIKDPLDPTEFPKGSVIVQIANRYQTQVRIHKASWEQLDDINKVALLVHEAVYGLIKPTPAGKDRYVQSAAIAREITSRLFAVPRTVPTNFLNFLERSLGVPNLNRPLVAIRRPGKIEFRYAAEPRGDLKSDIVYFRRGEPREVKVMIRSICEQMKFSGEALPVSVSFENSPYRVAFGDYVASELGAQQVFTFIEERAPLQSNGYVRDLTECLDYFQRTTLSEVR